MGAAGLRGSDGIMRSRSMITKSITGVLVCARARARVCVCVCVRERERENPSAHNKLFTYFYLVLPYGVEAPLLQ